MNRNSLLAYIATMIVAAVALSLLPYLGPPFNEDWPQVVAYWRGIFGF